VFPMKKGAVGVAAWSSCMEWYMWIDKDSRSGASSLH